MSQYYQQVFQRAGDPRIYLNVRGQWYYYDPNSMPLGDGAMGTVYLGFSCNSNQRIAVKRVKDIYANNIMIRERSTRIFNFLNQSRYINRILSLSAGTCE